MKLTKPILPMLAGLLFLLNMGPVDASQDVQLTDQVKKALSAAEPVRGTAVDGQMFNGKPVLVVFFASW